MTRAPVLGNNDTTMTAVISDGYLETLAHIESVFSKLTTQVGRGRAFSFPDAHKLTEGLFLNAWTYWEAFLFDLMWEDLGADVNGILRREVQRFRTKILRRLSGNLRSAAASCQGVIGSLGQVFISR